MAQGTTKGVPIDKDATLSNDSDLLVPSQKAVKTYVDSGLAGKQTNLGYTPPRTYNQNTTPTGTGTSSIPLGSLWFHSDTGIQYTYYYDGNTYQWTQETLPLGPQGPQGANGTNIVNGSTATTFTGLLKGNGSVISATTVLTEIGFTPENVANKENTTLDTSSTKYPTNNLVKTSLDSFADDVDYAIMTNQRILFNF
jgi:hypothetical protein